MLNKFGHNSLYAITDREIAGLEHPQIVSEFLVGGAKVIQLREKKASTKDFYEAALESVKLTKQKGACLIINDRVDIAEMVGADGVHLGQDDIAPEKARLILGDSAIIGISTHSMEQALIADKLPVDYIAVGPIFPSLTKPEASDSVLDKQIGLKLLEDVCKLVTKPVVAIGGITLDNALSVLATGAGLVAVISDLAKYGNISQRTSKFLEKLNN
jgi:thiamine-phosphate pyrophosphorylase